MRRNIKRYRGSKTARENTFEMKKESQPRARPCFGRSLKAQISSANLLSIYALCNCTVSVGNFTFPKGIIGSRKFGSAEPSSSMAADGSVEFADCCWYSSVHAWTSSDVGFIDILIISSLAAAQ